MPHHTQGKKKDENACIHCGITITDILNGASSLCSFDSPHAKGHEFPVTHLDTKEAIPGFELTDKQVSEALLTSKGWEKEFDELFLRIMYQDDGYSEERKELKSFIRSVESRAREEERERIVKVLEGMKKTPMNEQRESVADIHNSALSSAIEAINK